MPHVSNKRLDAEATRLLNKQLLVVIQKAGAKTRLRIFDELLTETEKIMLAKRIGMLYLLRKGVSTYQVSKTLGVSPSTAERFERAFKKGAYRTTASWVWRQSPEGSFDKFMESLVKLVFTGKTRSLKEVIDDL